MDPVLFAFYAFAAIAVIAAGGVISVRNPVHAVLCLILTFFSVACVWLLVGAEFLGVALVLVYVGAVMVLFLFVVMMLDIHIDTVRKGFWKHFPLAATVGALIALEMAAVLMGGFRGMDEPKAAAVVLDAAGQVVPYSNTKALGKLLYTEYLFPVEVAAVILLVAMISAIALTLRQRKDSKAINPAAQIRVRAADRLAVLKMAPTQKPVADLPAEPVVEEKKQ